MSDPSSEAFFARVNEDEIQRLRQKVETLERENQRLMGVIDQLKKQATKED